jgi:GNAT superfamily N-acetyltransferase
VTIEENQELQAPQPINSNYDLNEFNSGYPELDDWLKSRALKNEGEASRTYVVTVGQKVIAYYCLATASVIHAEAPGRVKRNMPDPIPLVVIGRLAVDSHWQQKGIGSALLRDAVLRILQASEILGIRAILVHAISERAKKFYEERGFIPSPVNPMTLMVTLASVRIALSKDKF